MAEVVRHYLAYLSTILGIGLHPQLREPEFLVHLANIAPRIVSYYRVFVDDILRLSSLVGGLGLFGRLLYLAMSPSSIFDIKYILAMLYVIYALFIAGFAYQAGLDTTVVHPLDRWRPEHFNIKGYCPICQHENEEGIEQMVTLQCLSDAEQALEPNQAKHSFHTSCLRQAYRTQGHTRCPICRRTPQGYQRRYGPPIGLFDDSALFWYIHTFFTRRLPLIRNAGFYARSGPPEIGIDSAYRMMRHWEELLIVVVPAHALLMTILLLAGRLIGEQWLTMPFPILGRVISIASLFLSLHTAGYWISGRIRDQLFNINYVMPAFSRLVLNIGLIFMDVDQQRPFADTRLLRALLRTARPLVHFCSFFIRISSKPIFVVGATIPNMAAIEIEPHRQLRIPNRL
ncbi:hypothetical protein F5Y19DRAFT_485030 [Xylariaceae sp. FL1651]|nr:hypothetical protein F5Y19DRAFT_485030 [Xylariaceae sp. FL1651]